MSRFFTDDIHGDTATITGGDVHHMTRVLRLRVGDTVEICDGDGTDYTGAIQSMAEDRVVCSLAGGHLSPTEPVHAVTLFQGLPKTGKMETIVQKCVELGVVSIVPTMMRRCVSVPDGKELEKKRARWQKVAEEAAKQSRRGRIPEILPAVTLDKFDFSQFDTVLTAYELEKANTLRTALRTEKIGQKIALVIGPEGGLEASETAHIVACGGALVSLGARILRTETAGMAMLAQILYEVEP